MKQSLIIGFNKDWALDAGKEKFIEKLKDVYPGHDLEAEWNKISPSKKAIKPAPQENTPGTAS